MTETACNAAVNMNDATASKPISPSPKFELLLQNNPARAQAETFIADKYRRVYNAELNEFLPIIVSISQAGTRAAAFGLRPGHYRPMFLEQYLDSPVEHQVAALSRQPVDRSSLIEVGNLVISRNGYGPLLLATLAMSLAAAGYEWMVFTVTEQVERLMKRLGFNPHCLVLADPDRLTADKASWGTYYANKPRVMIGSLAQAVTIISNSPRLWAIAQQCQDQSRDIANALSDYRRLRGR